MTVPLAAVLCLLVSGCAGERPAADYRIDTVTRAPFESVVRLDADLEARRQQDVTAPVSAVVTSVTTEGFAVKRGETIAVFDASEARRELAEKLNERERDQLELELQKLELDADRYELENRHAFGTFDLETLRIKERLLRTGVDAAEVVKAELGERNAATQSKNLKASLEEKAPFALKGFVSVDEMQGEKLKLEQQKLEARVQQLSRSLLLKGAPAKDVAEASRSVALSVSALELVKSKLDTFEMRRKGIENEIAARLAGVEKEIEFARSTIASSIVTATIDGIVIYQPYNLSGPDEVKVRPGSSVYRGIHFLKVAAAGGAKLAIKVPERDVLRVRKGNLVRVRPATAPDRLFEGRVTEVRKVLSGTGFGRWLHPQVWTLAIGGTVEDADPMLAPGATAIAEVVVAARPAVSSVDSAALARPGQVQLEDGSWREVQAGESGYERTEIISGLSEGEKVRVPSPVTRPPAGSAPVEARRGDLTLAVEDTGTLEPMVVRDIFVRDIEGETKIAWLAREGATVSAGDVVARLDERQFKDKLLEKKLELDTAVKDDLAQQEKLASEVNTLRQQLSVAEQDLEIEKIELSLLRQGKTKRERVDLDADLELARQALEAARRQLAVKEELAKKGYASRSEIKELSAKAGEAEAAFEVAKVKVELAKQGASELDRRRAEVQVEKARLTLDLSRRKLAAGERKKELTLERTKLAVDLARSRVTRFERMVASATVTAPNSGTVVLVERWSNEGPVKTRPGDNVDEGVAFMRIANLSGFEVKGTVPEGKVRFVQPGQEASFWLSSNPAELFPARVEQVVPFAVPKVSNRWSFFRRSAKVFEVRLATSAASRKFQPGISIGFRIVTRRIQDTVLVPVGAMMTDWRGSFVFDLAGNRRDIVCGQNNATELAVESGLAAGEKILGPSADAN